MMPERPQSEDVLVYRETARKTRLSVEEEFIHDLTSKMAFESARDQRLFGGVSPQHIGEEEEYDTTIQQRKPASHRKRVAAETAQMI